MDRNNILIGIFLAALFIGAAWWHIRENAKFESYIKKKTDANTAQWLVRFAWSRTLQLLAALGCMLVIFLNYDKQLSESRSNLDALTEIVEKKDKLEKQFAIEQKKFPPRPIANPRPAVPPNLNRPAAPPANPALAEQQPRPQVISQTQAIPPRPQPLPATQAAPLAPAKPPVTVATTQIIAATQPAAISTQTTATPGQLVVLQDNTAHLQDTDNSLAADLSQAQSQNNPQTAPATETAPQTPSNNNETIDALYNPEKNQSDRQSSMDDIKKRYEDILVIHLFLKKCDKIQPNDFNTISYAMGQEMAAVDAPQKLQTDIIDAAQGSYNEIYAQSPCNGKGIDNLNNQYNNYIKVLATNFPQN